MDPQTGAFVPLPAYSYHYPNAQYPIRAVRFEIKNVGTKTVPAGWQFTANLPLYPPYLYTSPPQAAVTPGSGIVFTLGWSAPNYGVPRDYVCTLQYPNHDCSQIMQPYKYNSGILNITADPYGRVPDLNRSNNFVSTSL